MIYLVSISQDRGKRYSDRIFSDSEELVPAPLLAVYEMTILMEEEPKLIEAEVRKTPNGPAVSWCDDLYFTSGDGAASLSQAIFEHFRGLELDFPIKREGGHVEVQSSS